MPNPIGSSNRTTLAMVEEPTFAVTPTNPVFTKIRYTGESLNFDISTTQSKEIRDDRNVANTVQVKAGSQGDIQYELSTEAFDALIQAAMCGTWTTTSQLIENCEDAWNEITNPNVTSTADISDFRVGTSSAKLAVGVGAVAGEILASEAITSLNLTTATAIRLWVKSSIATAAGDLKLLLDDTASCVSPIESVSFPALVPNVWTAVTLPLATPGALTAVISIGIKQMVDLGIFTLNIDEVRSLPEGGTIKNGVTNRSFTVQKGFLDTTPPIYNTYKGQRIGSMSVDFKSGSILTGKFALMGTDATMSTTQLSGASFIEAPTDVPMNGVNNITSILENNVTSVQAFKSITLNLENTLRAQDAIGSLAPIGIGLGTCVITGSFDVYFSDLVMYNRFVNNTSMALAFKAQDSSGSFYNFGLPSIKIETSKITSGGQDQDIMVACTYRAIYDPVTMCQLQITRNYS
jgi:hypothetical protein